MAQHTSHMYSLILYDTLVLLISLTSKLYTKQFKQFRTGNENSKYIIFGLPSRMAAHSKTKENTFVFTFSRTRLFSSAASICGKPDKRNILLWCSNMQRQGKQHVKKSNYLINTQSVWISMQCLTNQFYSQARFSVCQLKYAVSIVWNELIVLLRQVNSVCTRQLCSVLREYVKINIECTPLLWLSIVSVSSFLEAFNYPILHSRNEQDWRVFFTLSHIHFITGIFLFGLPANKVIQIFHIRKR